MTKLRRLHVAALINTTTSWGRNLIRGVNNYNRNHGNWNLWLQSRTQENLAPLPPKWNGDGIIACLTNDKTLAQVKVRGKKIAVVNVSAIEFETINFPRVATDQCTAGKLAAKHLLNRGFVNFAYYGLKDHSLIDRQYQSFSTAVSGACKSCGIYKVIEVFNTEEQAKWRDRQKQLLRWLRSLPKPVAIVAWNAELGRELLFACSQEDFLVPEQVAILVCDDDLLCEACTPSLSAIRLNSQQIGYKAAAVLDQLMQGEKPKNCSILVTPINVATRQSTDTLAIDNEELARAIAFIRDNASRPIQVKDVLNAVPMSRRLLEQHFRKILNRSPAQEIRRVHIELAKRLLMETDLQIPNVADASGFGSPEHFARYFKAQVGISPLRFRSTVQGN